MRGRAASPGSQILTICEGLETHLAAVFAKAGHGPRSHLHHVDGSRPEALHASRVGLAPHNGGVNLCVVLQTANRLEMLSFRKYSRNHDDYFNTHNIPHPLRNINSKW